MTDDASPENLRKFLESDDPAMVMMGISLAKGAGVEVTVKDLERFLKSEDVETIKTGVMLAGEAGILIQTLEKSEEYEEELNQEIIFALGELGDKKAIDTLRSKMEIYEGYYDWQSCLLEAVGKIGGPDAAWFLVEALGGAYDDEKINGLWAGDALSALKNIGEPAVDAVTTVLYGYGGDTFANRDSWEVLNETIGWLREVIGDKKTSKILLKLLKEDISGKEHDHRDDWDGCPLCSSIQARACAAICLGNMEHDSALEKLAEVQELILSESEEIDDAERDISYGSATYLTLVLGAQGKVGDVQAVEQLIHALGDEDEFICKAATEALGVIGDKRAVEPLIKALGDNNRWARQNAVAALGKIGDARAVEPLIEALGDDNGNVSWAAKKALRKLGHEVE
jgi:HEAT repeat protein